MLCTLLLTKMFDMNSQTLNTYSQVKKSWNKNYYIREQLKLIRRLPKIKMNIKINRPMIFNLLISYKYSHLKYCIYFKYMYIVVETIFSAEHQNLILLRCLLNTSFQEIINNIVVI